MKHLISFFTSIVLCGAFVTTVFAEPVTNMENTEEKFSEHLLEEYGVSRERLKTFSGRINALQSNEKVPVLVWFANDINHQIVLRKALDIITDDLSEELNSLKFSVTEKTTLDDILELGIEPSADAVQKYIEKEREISRELYTELNKEFIEKHMSDNEILYTSLYSPVVIANISLAEALKLADDDKVLEFAYSGNDYEDENELNISTVVTEAKRTYNTYGYTGSGVKIGQFEKAVPDVSDNEQLSPITSNIHINPTSIVTSPSISTLFDIRHANAVADIMVGQRTNNYSAGIAPNAQLYCTSNMVNEEYYDRLNAMEWLLNNGVNVINASVVFGSDGRNSYGSYSKWLDHIAKDHFVTVVKSSGNDSDQENSGVSSGGMAYNIITVGNINDQNTVNLNDDTIHPTSCYYDENSGLAYKPDLCAPGTEISCAARPVNDAMTGTSASAPHVSGAVALMFEAKPLLKLYPEAVKAILTASVNPNSNHRYCVADWSANSSVDSYAKYGSGLLDIYYAVNTARNYNFSYGKVSSLYNLSTHTMHISSRNSTVRVSLAFHINNTANPSHTALNDINHDHLQDLDLIVVAPDGTTVWESESYYNNVENVEFIATQTGDYTIKVKKLISSYSSWVEYGVAWMEAN